MNRSILTISILMTTTSFASYVVVVDKEKNDYDSTQLIEQIEYSNWIKKGENNNCINQSPLSSEIYEGTSFNQTADCDENQERTKSTYSYNQITGEKKLKSEEKEYNSVKVVDTSSVLGEYEAISCSDIISHAGDIGDGYYNIKPNNNKITALCDMENGGYTMISQSSATAKLTHEIESSCSTEGMKLFIPRTESHLKKAIVAIGSNYFNALGIYPNAKGNKCSTVYFNSDSCTEFDPIDNGKWFVYNWDMSYPHNGGGFGFYPEPNGDNDLGLSLSYTFNSSGVLTAMNDIQSSSVANPGGYTFTKWTCSSIGEETL